MLTDNQNCLEMKRSDKRVTVALINTRSGERTAAEFVRRQMETHLGEENVFYLFPSDKPAIPEAKKFLERHNPAVVIVAGGDGTVSLVLDITDGLRGTNMLSATSAYVAVLPMGTGNDLSRTLGFGGGYVKPLLNPEKKFKRFLDRVAHAKGIKMDRWSVQLQKKSTLTVASTGEDAHTGASSRTYGVDDVHVVEKTMMNYFSIGFDATIVRQFGDFRNDHPTMCSRRSLNKLWYGCFGCGAMCNSVAFPRKQMKLTVDDKCVAIPPGTKALLVTNVKTYAGGAVFWKDNRCRFAKPDVGDGLLEVTALYGVWHLAGVRMGIRKAIKVAQGNCIRIETPAYFAMQLDGEPLDELACSEEMIDVSITLFSRTLVMTCEGS
ncbi:putative diacylglycerol kinase-like protein [Trypanosoma cruzi]|uniref:Diacylglycerol kinase n=2 Tax=Trypanosoma cruzi TaxID=5693 RepID=Q4E3I4_TRYCC|nr:diacylglycerol kinase-like protein, putative [Trypanosoma cruzi]EAN99355.1 diacylglycerol kinase-like protein, putative [Trypanosoma cruzi]PWU91961.1 putative diacylglycerol kinase-like protein [Trypanosoma cruzi]RNC42630.1 putative diacylglycerol kinase-like protein [Trypanosoma cruzi]|eukprot:XP_821206.1 diacylglycerol kinase-like protein [Trypanosoma cruzi strain CL Brener]